MPFKTQVISAQLELIPELIADPESRNQWVGGLGSTLGDGGSLNFAPAYARLVTGDRDGEALPSPYWNLDGGVKDLDLTQLLLPFSKGTLLDSTPGMNNCFIGDDPAERFPEWWLLFI